MLVVCLSEDVRLKIAAMETTLLWTLTSAVCKWTSFTMQKRLAGETVFQMKTILIQTNIWKDFR